MNHGSDAWRQHVDVGKGYEHAGMTERALTAYTDAISAANNDTERAEAHVRVAHLYRTWSKYDDAARHSKIAYTLAREAGSDDLAAEAINVDVGALFMRGELDEAQALSERGLALCKSPRMRGITLQNQANIAARRGDLPKARELFEESIIAFREARYEIGITMALVNVAMLAHDAAELAEALDFGDLAIASARSQMAHDLLLTAVQNQSQVMVKLGRFDQAHTMLSEAFGFFTTAGNLVRQAECLEIMGDLSALRDTDLATARRSFARAQELADRGGDVFLSERIRQKVANLSSD